MSPVDLVVDCRNILGEGVTWDAAAQRLCWVDIESSEFWTLDPVTGKTTTHKAPERITCFAPRRGSGLIAAFANCFSLYDPANGAREDIAAFEPNDPNTRLNDGRTDRQGRFIAGGFDEREGKFVSSVVRLDPDKRVTKLIDGVACANSICFSPDGRTMYFADTPARTIWAFEYDVKTGSISNRRVLTRFDGQPGQPDGSCVDAEGYVWNAQWNGHRVARFAPDGRVDRIIPLPALNPTCVAFGGAALDTLYITTASYLMSPAQLADEPEAGALYATRPGVKGLADTPFKG